MTLHRKVAILLAAYNGEKYIESQIDSIKKQHNFNIHIFVSIDISNDRTLEICEKYSKDIVTVLPFPLKNFGSAGSNFYRLFRDVDIEKFDYIALADQDDLWKEKRLERAISLIEENQLDAYSSNVECFWDKTEKIVFIKKSFRQREYDYIFEPAGPGCTYILTKKLARNLKKEILNSHQRLPFHHDWFIYAFARKNNYRWYIDDLAMLRYRQHDRNQVGANHGLKQKITRLFLLKNGVYKKQYHEILESIGFDEDFKKKVRSNVIKNPFKYRRNPKEAIILFLFALIGWI